jgi:hypothetical protein
MKREDLRTPEEKFDDLLADDHSIDEIAYRLGWSNWRKKPLPAQVCADMGELPDEI